MIDKEDKCAYIKEKDRDYFTIQDEWENDRYIVSTYDLDKILECISSRVVD